MPTKKLTLISLANATGVVIYVTIVATIMRNGNKIFGQEDNFFTPIAALLLFVLSAAVTGSLVLGRPTLLFLEGAKKEAVKLFLYTLGWLFLITLALFIILVVLK